MTTNNSLATLANLDDAVLAEVVREGEATVQAQLTVSLAADQRAVSFSSIVLTAATAVLAAVAALLRETPTDWPLALLAAMLAVGLFASGALALAIARPAPFCLPGNDPKNWMPEKWDLPPDTPRSLAKARYEQALVLQSHIAQNRQAATANARGLRIALAVAYVTVAIAGVALLGVALDRVL